MTVEQRKFKNVDGEAVIFERSQIKPGDTVVTSVRIIESTHLHDSPHREFNAKVVVSCKPDDSSGRVVYSDPWRGTSDLQIFPGEIEVRMTREGKELAGIEWEHIPDKDVDI